MNKLRRHRLRVVLVALLSLLFQQLAVASYACEMDGLAETSATTAVAPCHVEVRDAARCHAHCNPTSSTVDTGNALTVPPCALPASLPAFVAVDVRSVRPGLMHAVHAHANSPPLNLAYCTLLI